ncbi:MULTISPECIES: DUF397 domain-containing protein [unclassified Streptomyces]|uniref:DUF397 domain-containing protein n=1 Tax=unclassified Streptomyces TaxID=2593676 RepID=UPI00339ED5FD
MSLEFSGNTSELRWSKSSYSGSNNNDCVEVAASPRAVRVRDSKNVPGPEIGIGQQAWTHFVGYAAGS